MSTLKLRQVDARTHAGAQAVQRWQWLGVSSGVGCPPRRCGYLRFQGRGDGGDWEGLIMAHDWLHHALPQLQTLLKVECPLESIAGLFRAVPRPLSLEVQALHYQQLFDVEQVDPQALPSHQLPWLDTPQGRMWVTQLPVSRSVITSLGADAWLHDLPLRLELMLGVSQLHPGRRLCEGDVLRIIQRTQQCWLANRCLGVFTFTERGIHMQSTTADDHQQNTLDPENPVDLGSVSVRLEFLLATHEVELAALSQIIGGQLLPLPDDAAHHIEIRANGKRVARGELVQVGEQLGVELLEVYRNDLSEPPQ